jgi:hypothetical protein
MTIEDKFSSLLAKQSLRIERVDNVLDLRSGLIVSKWTVYSGCKAIKSFPSQEAAIKFIDFKVQKQS